MRKTRLSAVETRILEQFWKLGTSSVREILESLPEDETVAYATVPTLVYRLEQKEAGTSHIHFVLIESGRPRPAMLLASAARQAPRAGNI